MQASLYVSQMRDRVPGGFTTHEMYRPFQDALATIAAEYGVKYELIRTRHGSAFCTASSIERIVSLGVPDERIIALAVLMFPDLT